MLNVITEGAKIKALLAVLSLLAIGGIYSMAGGDPGIIPAAESKDPYILGIQNQADLVENSVNGVIEAQKTQESWQFKQTCEEATSFIRTENLEAEQAYLKLDPDQKTVNENYRAFLHEAALVVSTCYSGQIPDTAAMQAAKANLF